MIISFQWHEWCYHKHHSKGLKSASYTNFFCLNWFITEIYYKTDKYLNYKLEVKTKMYLTTIFATVFRHVFAVKPMFPRGEVHITQWRFMGMWKLSQGFKWQRHSLWRREWGNESKQRVRLHKIRLIFINMGNFSSV